MGDYATEGNRGETKTLIITVEDYEAMKDRIAQLEAELAECRRKSVEIKYLLGHALYGHSNEEFPLWGEHTAETLAEEAGRKLGQNPPEKWSPDPPFKPTEKNSASPST